MRILLVSSGSGSRGGGETFLAYLGEGLSKRGHDVVMWIPNHPRMDELAATCVRFAHVVRAKYYNTYDYATRSLATCFNWNVSYRVAREWQGLCPDIIHINKQNLEDGLDLLRAARRCAMPSVCTIHLTQPATYLGARVASLRDWISRAQLRQYRGILVAVQERRCAVLREFLTGQSRVETIFNGVPSVDSLALHATRDRVRRELGMAPSDFLILGIGRLVQQKRPFHFLSIAKELYERVPNVRFLWVGDGPLVGEWRRQIARQQLDTIITCVGWQADVLPFLVAGDLLLHLAEYEGLPFAVIEAMAAGLPCAVTRNLSCEIPLFNDQNVLFADDLENLANKVRSPSDLCSVIQKAYRLVQNELSLKKMTDSYEQLYLDAISHGSTSSDLSTADIASIK